MHIAPSLAKEWKDTWEGTFLFCGSQTSPRQNHGMHLARMMNPSEGNGKPGTRNVFIRYQNTLDARARQ